MTKVRVACFAVSADGYGAGPNQSIDNPLGADGPALFSWFFPTQTFQRMHGGGEGATGIDDDFAVRSFENVGAWIMGRNMFGPVRGPWENEDWKGWWGPNPPYHVPVFVLTHYPRASLAMEGGTVFHFVTDGIEAAFEAAKAAAAGRDVRIGGGVATVRQYLKAGLVDEMHLAVAPALLGAGENLFGGLDLPRMGFRVTKHVSSPAAMHLVLENIRRE